MTWVALALHQGHQMIRFLSDAEKRFALGKFGLLQVGKYSKGGSNPRFLIDLATFDLLCL